MTMRCDACATENPATSRFCGGCGAALGQRCPVCSAPVIRGFRYCGACGTELGDELTRSTSGVDGTGEPFATGTGEPIAVVPSAERRRVSILFVDLVSFTSQSEGRDPEEVQELLARYFETCRGIIARYGGTVEKFIGDAVMAMWGAPVAHEDDAERAVRAAVELVAAVAAVGEQVGLASLAARAGVVSGEAAVTVGALGQGMVAGDVVNTASRLQAAARPGTVLVDQSTYRAVHGSVTFERAGERSLKGKRLPVQAWEARKVVALRGGEGRSVLPEGPLVGRDSLVTIVKSLLAAVRDERSPRLVSLFGQAGLGKSRIAWELEKYVDGVVEKIRWHRAGSPAYGEGLAFWALAEMVRSRAEITEQDPPDVARRRLASCLATFVPDEAERRWIAPYLAGLIGAGPVPGGERAEAFAAWRTFFERVADSATTVLVFDDLQWADPGLLDFIEYLVDASTGRPILVVTLARPQLLDARPTWGAGRRNFIALHLDPLPRPAMAQLLGDLAPGLPADIAERILERAEGVPLYAVEILRMLVDRGALEAVDGVYEVRSRLERLAVPESLHALVAARLDDLEPIDRTLIRHAAVLGRAFSQAALAAIGRATAEAVEPHLQRLVQRELLALETNERSPSRDRYRFAEALVREVAYGTLSLRDRRELHGAAAAYFESVHDPDLAGAIASHLLSACRSGPPGRPDRALATRAVTALRAAADRAAALHSPAQALDYLEGALSLTADDTERAQLWEQAAIAAQASAHLKDAAGYARQAVDWHAAHGDRSARARTTARLSSILALGYETKASIAVVRAALDELVGDAVLGDDPELVALMADLARAYLLDGRFDDAVAWAERAILEAERLGLRTIVAGALATKGAAWLEDGRNAEGIGLLRGSLAMSEEHGLVIPALRARNSIAVGLLTDDPRAAFAMSDAGLETARRLGLLDVAVRLASNWAGAGLDIGAWDQVLATMGELDRDDLTVPDRIDLGSVVATILTWRGESDADGRFGRLDALLATQPDPLASSVLLSRRSLALLSLGRAREALAHTEATTLALSSTGLSTLLLENSVLTSRAALWAADRGRLAGALDAIRAVGPRGRWLTAVTTTLAAGLDALDGRTTAARDGYGLAAARWRTLDVPLQLALCQVEAAHFLPTDTVEAAAAADEARAILAGLGAMAFIARLDGHLAEPVAPAATGGPSTTGDSLTESA
ncbi:MAG TPA: adenylate/guanylate cyclase domain-containing protein [Candidatus Limnocylindrales bacterium]